MITLVLGATGFIGPRVVDALEAHGSEIVAASRGGEGPYGIALDRRDVDAVRTVVRERGVDTVIDLLAYTREDTIPLLDALDGHVGRWVMASSGDVYRNFEGLIRKAQPEAINEPLKEGSPLRTIRFPMRLEPARDPSAADAFMDDYDKLPLETHLRSKRGLSGTVLRFPMIYGPGDAQRRFQWIVGPMLERKDELVVHPDWAEWRTSYAYVDNIADALVVAARHPDAPSNTFNLGGDYTDASSHRDWIDRFARKLGWRGEVVLDDSPREEGPQAALNLRYWLLIDGRAFREKFGWKEPVGIDAALERTIEDERQRS